MRHYDIEYTLRHLIYIIKDANDAVFPIAIMRDDMNPEENAKKIFHVYHVDDVDYVNENVPDTVYTIRTVWVYDDLLAERYCEAYVWHET